jgi:transposase
MCGGRRSYCSPPRAFGTNAIMHETGESKTCVWRWQERFAAEGVDRLLRGKTRPSRVPKLDPSVDKRVVTLTKEQPPCETTHWTRRGDWRQHQFRAAHPARA